MTEQIELPAYLTVKQVAKRFGCSTDSIWRWKSEGNFPAPVRIGPNCTRWRLTDIHEFESQLQTCFTTCAFWDEAA